MRKKAINIINKSIFAAAIAGLLYLLNCSSPIGGGSEAGNARITGQVVDSLGAPVKNAIVMVRASTFDPVKDNESTATSTATTNVNGMYEISVQKGYIYTVEAKLPIKNTNALLTEVTTFDEENPAPQCTLKIPGAIKVKIPENIDKNDGYLFIPGTSVFALLKDVGDYLVLRDVPAVTISELSYSSITSQDVSIVRQNVDIQSGDTSVIYNPLWKYQGEITINTTSSGADVSGDVVDFPVCIRLTSADFDFDQARSDGLDICFTKQDGTPLPYEIEYWDRASGKAAVWVKVDTIYGNNNTQYINMYWGNPDVSTGSNSSAVFDVSNGFQGVWHMAGKGTETVYDATDNQYDGTPYGMTIDAVVPGVIGDARYFDGKENYVVMPNTASGKLDMPQNGTYSISLWAYVDTLDTLWHVISGKGHEQYYLKFKCFKKDKATWEFVEFQDQKGWEFTEDSIPPAPGIGQWVYLTGVRSGTNQYLFINGNLVSDTICLQTGTYTRYTGDDFMIGRYARQVTIPSNEGWCYFKGMIDEVRVMDVALTADWIKLSYMNQKAEDALVNLRRW